MWRETQQQFAAALCDPLAPVPAAVSKTNGAPSKKRFDVYRNNITVSLTEALADTYPVVFALIGAAFFNNMAGIFIRQHLPATPVLIDYGAEFADFIELFEAAATLPYLSDVARLEWAWLRAYHAADVTPVSIKDLAARPGDTTPHIRLRFHPSFHLLKSSSPVVSIWHAHRGDNSQDNLENLPHHCERAMVVRPELDVVVRNMDAIAFDFIKALHRGQTLGEASHLVIDKGPLDLSAHIAAVFKSGAVVGLSF